MILGLFPQRDFSAGQIDIDGERHDDLEFVQSACRLAENLQIGPSGNLKRRPGSRYLYATHVRVEEVHPDSGQAFDIAFAAGTFIALHLNTGGSQTITGCPWAAGDIEAMEIEEVDNTVVVTHQDWRPQVFRYDRAFGIWGRADFEFRIDPNGAVRQPYHRFADDDVTMKPSARTGAITVTFSASVLVSGHVGTIFTWGDRQLRITSVISGTSGNADVIEDLPQTHRVLLDSAEGFEIGDVVEETNGGISGVITKIENVGGAAPWAVNVVAYIQDGDEATNAELLVGPRGSNTISSSSVVTPDAMRVWKEQFFSGYRGWPGAVMRAYGRLFLYRTAQERRAWTASAPGVWEDFKVLGEPDGALFEFAPEATELRHMRAGGDIFLLLDTSIYSIPVNASSPLQPGSVEYRYVGNVGASSVRPVLTGQGIVYVSSENGRVMAIASTGLTAQPYKLEGITRYHQRLIDDPVSLAISRGLGTSPIEYLYVVNGDGTLTVGRYDPVKNWVGFMPWTLPGKAVLMTSRHDRTLIVIRVGAAVSVAEISEDYFLDGAVPAIEVWPETPLTDGDGDPITDELGDPITIGGEGFPALAGRTVDLQDGDQYFGEFPVDADGFISDPPEGHENGYVGFKFIPHFQPIVPNFGGGQSRRQRLRKRRIATASITVRETTGFRLGNRQIAAYVNDDNQENPPPRRDKTYRVRVLGRSHDPTVDVRQPTPGPFNIIEFTTEATT